MMPHPLEKKLADLRRRHRRMVAIYSLSIVGTTLLCALAAFGTIDFLLRFQDRGLRIIASLSALVAIGWISYRFVGSRLFTRLTDVDLALNVERFFQKLADHLASAVEFLHQSDDDPTAGSASLRRAVIAQTTAESQQIDFSNIVDVRPTFRAAAVLAMACLLSAILVALAPSVSQTAVVRLLNPFSDAAWPQTNHFVMRRPVERIARGQNFRIDVIDAHGVPLPSEVNIHYRLPGPDGTVEETERMRFADGAMVAERENIQRPFSFRVEGGDDQTSIHWTNVDVTEPPAVESISIRLIPPAYTGKPSTSSERHILATIGTRLEITGRATTPLASAELCFESGRKVPEKLAADGRTFAVAVVVEKSGQYWFALTDREGFHGGDDRWEIQAIADTSPTVRINQPTANLFVTPQAIAPIRVSAKDDLALRDISLVFRSNESTPEASLPLYAGSTQPPPQSEPTPPGDSRVVDYRWNLASLNLQPGTQLTFYATAADYLPQVGKSDPRRLIVVTPGELQDRIADREKLLVTELERALKMQRGCREQVESLRVRLGKLQQFEQSDVDRLQAVEHAQREIHQLLAARGEGVPIQALALLADIENNGIDNADTRQRMTALLKELARLDREIAPSLGRDLTAAVKTAQIDHETQSVAKLLAAAADYQKSIIASLERQISQLARWDGFLRLHRELGQLLRDQDDVAGQTSIVGRRTLTRDLRDLSPQDSADLKTAAGRQLELARILDRMLQEADEARVELQKSDAVAADSVADAIDEARRLAIGNQMRATGSLIHQNHVGQAAAAQKQIAHDLQAVLDVLAKRSLAEARHQVEQIRKTAAGSVRDLASPLEDDRAVQDHLGNRQSQPETRMPEKKLGDKPGIPGASHQPDDAAARKAEAQAMMKRLWGILPEREREQMLQSPVEEFVPKYELQIEEYFRRLSKEKPDQ